MSLHPGPSDVVRIRPDAWCRRQLSRVSEGRLSARDERRARPSLRVVCVAEGDDVVLLVEEDAEQTWSLVWSEVTVEVTGTADDG